MKCQLGGRYAYDEGFGVPRKISKKSTCRLLTRGQESSEKMFLRCYVDYGGGGPFYNRISAPNVPILHRLMKSAGLHLPLTCDKLGIHDVTLMYHRACLGVMSATFLVISAAWSDHTLVVVPFRLSNILNLSAAYTRARCSLSVAEYLLSGPVSFLAATATIRFCWITTTPSAY